MPVSDPTKPGATRPDYSGRVWCPDRGDGTYQNPVLFGDYSDPDVIRVGPDFWLTSSSFNHVPGLPILHSRDLVNWTLVNHALPRLVPDLHFSQPRHGEGVWAPAIRYHAGKFWIYYPDPDFGLYVVTANDPRGAWSAPVMVKSGRGLIDPCPFWDEDGTGYLIHGWAKSRAGISNRLTLHRLDDDNRSVNDAGVVIINGDQMPGWHTIEGPKLYKRAGFYYVFAPAGGVREGYQAVFRSRAIFGPYENRIVLQQGSTAINGPHQGAWVDTPEGGHWFLHFQERPAYGRVVHLQPLHWEEDGWPRIGSGQGEPVSFHRKPAVPQTGNTAPATPQDFFATVLGWQWQANPQAAWLLPPTQTGAVRLRCVPLSPRPTLWTAGHLLMQKFCAPEFVVTTTVIFSPRAEGDSAGLVVFGDDYAWLGLRQENDELRLVLVACANAKSGYLEKELASIAAPAEELRLRVSVRTGASCRFSFASGDGPFVPFGPDFPAKSGRWVGAKVGIFAAGLPPAPGEGHAEFAWFNIEPGANGPA